MPYKEERRKMIAIKDMTLLNVAKIYCFMLDIEDQAQLPNSDVVTLSPDSPNVKNFPMITDKVMISRYDVGDRITSVTDWREGVIQYLVNRGIIKCEGVDRPLCHYSGAERFRGFQLIILDRSTFANLFKKVEATYRSKTVCDRQNIVTVSPKDVIDTKNQISAPPPNKNEIKKYTNEYPRKDIIKFTDKKTGSRSYIVLVNDRPAKIQYGKFALLLYLAIALKKETNKGWIVKDDAEKEQIVGNDITQFHRLVSELKDKLKPVEPNSETEIIENIAGESKYRLSTMPSRIQAPPGWLTKKYKEIRAEIIKERNRRVKP